MGPDVLHLIAHGLRVDGCTTMYKSAVDERSIGDQYDDQKITMLIKKIPKPLMGYAASFLF